MKKLLLSLLLGLTLSQSKAQVTTITGNYKIIDIGLNTNGDYTRSVVLLHEIYNGAMLSLNYAIGTITALRGHTSAFNRIDVVNVNTSSSYSTASGTISSVDRDPYENKTIWKLKTCLYAGKKYMAVDVPYGDAHHDFGFKFSGSTLSSGENMKIVSYEVKGQPINQQLISEIQDFSSDMIENHQVASLSISGNVGIGTTNPKEKLSVNGNIRAREIKVEVGNWPDYVFSKAHQISPLKEIEKHITEKGHLPGIPSASEVSKEGISLGEMNAKLLEKIEELTLHLIKENKMNIERQITLSEQREALKIQDNKIKNLVKRLDKLENKNNKTPR
ncbi:hypothetical protein SAMN05421820_107158 [Pedobacter steynii]|uniref:Uncharacterized protein n=1 Tax=Pedobacter steynii TaxID=430522 RepID=A0A1H0ANW5_9SPHI|nr:hypothetical protein [Pedobacter steynii]NQX41300.1 hypothetical protein [Pedobacter steynii]SDN35240.1 hypothetical protein SAMN05421820_107158 [Pedobacter steynii]